MLQNDNDARRKVIEHCQVKNKVAVNPIIGMTSQDVWEILRWRKVETNPLYQMGYDRVGCIGCPMAGKCQREKEFKDFPKYKDAYIRAFDRMLLVRKQLGLDGEGKTNWKDGYDVFDWWIENDDMEGQMTLEEYYHEFMEDDW